MLNSKKNSRIFKYLPSSFYGRYDFSYSNKRKMNYWFKYHLFPKYLRSVFFYDVLDNTMIDTSNVLLSGEHEKTIRGKENIGELFRKKESPQKDNGHNKQSNVLYFDSIELINKMQQGLESKLSEIDCSFEEFVDYYLQSEDLSINIFNPKPLFTQRQELEAEYMSNIGKIERDGNLNSIKYLSDFLLSRISSNLSIDTINLLVGTQSREIEELNDVKQITRKITNIERKMQKDVILKRYIEDLFIYGIEARLKYGRGYRQANLNKNTLEDIKREIKQNNIEKRPLRIRYESRKIRESSKVWKTSKNFIKEDSNIQTSFGVQRANKDRFNKSVTIKNKQIKTSKTAKIVRLVNSQYFINDKVSKDMSINDNKIFVRDKVSKDMSINDNQYFINDKVSKDTMTVKNEWYINISGVRHTGRELDTTLKNYKEREVEQAVNIKHMYESGINTIKIGVFDSSMQRYNSGKWTNSIVLVKEKNLFNEKNKIVFNNLRKKKNLVSDIVTNRSMDLHSLELQNAKTISRDVIISSGQVTSIVKDSRSKIIEYINNKNDKITIDAKIGKKCDIVFYEQQFSHKSPKKIRVVNKCLVPLNCKVSKNTYISNNQYFINDKVPKDMSISNNKIFVSNKVSKNTYMNGSQYFIKDKTPKDISINNDEVFVSNKVFKDISINESEIFANDKASKGIYTNENEMFVSDKVSKNISMNDNEYLINDKTLKYIGASGSEIFINGKVEKMIKLDDIQIGLSKGNKIISSTDNNTLFNNKSAKKIELEAILNDTKRFEQHSRRNINFSPNELVIGKTNKRKAFIKSDGHLLEVGSNKYLNENMNDKQIIENNNGTISSDLDDVEQRLDKVSKRPIILNRTISLNDTASKFFDNNKNKPKKLTVAEKTNKIGYEANKKLLSRNETEVKIKQEIDNRLDLHKRFWFVKGMGKTDYKILPNVDFNYPASVNIFDKDTYVDENYSFEYQSEFDNIDSPFIVKMYDKDHKFIASHIVSYVQEYNERINDIDIKLVINPTRHEHTMIKFKIAIYNHSNVEYMVIQQPVDYKGNSSFYVVTEKVIAEKHPIPFGSDLGIVEIPVHINIMVEFINMLLLMWSKFYMAFTGYTGTMAVYGLVNMTYEWLMLDTSKSDNMEDYHRCFRWLRWEAEKVYNKSRHDPDLSGNLWVEELIFEMIDYIEMHHSDKMSEFKTIEKMDEYRNIFNDPDFDIPVIIDKFKGIRNRVIDKNKRIND